MDENKFDSALSILNAIPDSFNLDEHGMINEHSNFTDYTLFCEDIHDNGRTILELESQEITDLQDIATSSIGRSSVMAWNILCFCYDICKDYPLSDDGGGSSRRANPIMDPQDFIRSQYYKLRVFPNPASDYATFEWELVHLEGSAVLKVFDSQGRKIADQSISTLQGQWLWDTRKLSTGVYFYELRASDQKMLNQGKVLIRHE